MKTDWASIAADVWLLVLPAGAFVVLVAVVMVGRKK